MPAPDPAEDRALLTEAAREAGRIARRYFETGAEVWDKGDGQGPVTEADLAVNGMLREALTAARPGWAWLSEESPDDPARAGSPAQVIVDPIDGTRAFVERSKDWSHALATHDAEGLRAAVVYLPMRDLLYSAHRGGGATLNDAPIRVSDRAALDGARVLAARPNLAPVHWRDGKVPPVSRHFRSSLAYRLARVAEGAFDAMLTLRPSWEWDIAAGALLVSEAGGEARDPAGSPLRFNNAHPQTPGVVAGGPVARALLDRLA